MANANFKDTVNELIVERNRNRNFCVRGANIRGTPKTFVLSLLLRVSTIVIDRGGARSLVALNGTIIGWAMPGRAKNRMQR